MFKLSFSFVLFFLAAAFFFGVDQTAEAATLRNTGVLVCSLALFIANLRTKVEGAIPDSAPAKPDIQSTPRGAAEATPKDGSEKQAVINFMSMLQQKGRLLDFLMDDVSKYSDTQVAAAARVVHQGCSGVLRDYFDIKPVTSSREGSALTLDRDFDAHSYRLLGRVVGEPPFSGKLLHKGWLTTDVKLPEQVSTVASSQALHGGHIIAPAEVELN
ncbi:MAG: DUF2760 domain-containing protein [Deltaproteobacteria bacterium]|nr:DUF2760 domain-containing protein [Deltaproteobacteria bacterium]